jgi:glycosyltransferase
VDESAKISIITVVLNGVVTISSALSSVKEQSYENIEHLVMDGNSTDGTLDILRAHEKQGITLLSEPDDGIYHALNKGIKLSSGEIIGILHSDDQFADSFVIESVMDVFKNTDIDVVYGDLIYVRNNSSGSTYRKWNAGKFKTYKLGLGWMPPHPTLFIRRSLFNTYGFYDTRYSISSDYDLILRYFRNGGVRSMHIKKVLVKMRVGGKSNRSFRHLLLKSKEDYLIIKRNKIGNIHTLFFKNISKVFQFFIKS